MPDTTIPANATLLPNVALDDLAWRYAATLRAAGHHPFIAANGRVGIQLSVRPPTPETVAAIASRQVGVLGVDDAPFASLFAAPDYLVLLAKATRETEPDSIFAAIECHRAARAEFNDVCGRMDELVASRHGREITEDDYAAYKAAEEADKRARQALFDNPPTTAPGWRALAAYIAYLNSRGDGDLLRPLCDALVRSLCLAPGV